MPDKIVKGNPPHRYHSPESFLPPTFERTTPACITANFKRPLHSLPHTSTKWDCVRAWAALSPLPFYSITDLALGLSVSACSHKDLHSCGVTFGRGHHKRCLAILFTWKDTPTMQKEAERVWEERYNQRRTYRNWVSRKQECAYEYEGAKGCM